MNNAPIGIYDSGLGGPDRLARGAASAAGGVAALSGRRQELPLRLAPARGGACACGCSRRAARGGGVQTGRRGLQYGDGRRDRFPAGELCGAADRGYGACRETRLPEYAQRRGGGIGDRTESRRRPVPPHGGALRPRRDHHRRAGAGLRRTGGERPRTDGPRRIAP